MLASSAGVCSVLCWITGCDVQPQSMVFCDSVTSRMRARCRRPKRDRKARRGTRYTGRCGSVGQSRGHRTVRWLPPLILPRRKKKPSLCLLIPVFGGLVLFCFVFPFDDIFVFNSMLFFFVGSYFYLMDSIPLTLFVLVSLRMFLPPLDSGGVSSMSSTFL